MNVWTTAVLIALVLACGAWLVLTAVRAVGAPSFAERIAPQLRVVQLSSAVQRPGLVAETRGFDLLSRRLLSWASRRIAPLAGNTAGLERRLVRAGEEKVVVDYRAEQVVFAVDRKSVV